jgi:molybdate transport system substrate-binding protein
VQIRDAGVFVAWLLTLVFWLAACTPVFEKELPVSSPQNETLVISAAASVTDALEDLGLFYQQSHPNIELVYNFGSSVALQRQIEQGAPVNVFIAAAAQPMHVLEQKGLLATGTRKNLLSNQVVLIVSKDRQEVKDFQALGSLAVARIAIGEPRGVPAGAYAQQVLATLKLWEVVQPKLVLAKDVRQVLGYVATGNVDAGVVYLTDARASSQVKVVAIAPASSHEPVVYPVAVLKNSQNISAAKSFVDFLFSSKAKTVFEKYGFAIAPGQ